MSDERNKAARPLFLITAVAKLLKALGSLGTAGVNNFWDNAGIGTMLMRCGGVDCATGAGTESVFHMTVSTKAVKGTGQDGRSPEKNSLSKRESPASLQDLAESLLCRLAFTNAVLKREGPEITVGEYCSQVLRLTDDWEGGISSRGAGETGFGGLDIRTELRDPRVIRCAARAQDGMAIDLRLGGEESTAQRDCLDLLGERIPSLVPE
ncbi:hypothetical protein AK812_SmicGene22649 [Symbiodinium microadriaticum]|uniref:Uncharacterized protein n=1 Tax=Symbiodinium microadriaticum TaxID=2951 RepID=A0A1Q9DJ96_SYMMI|nr:hypothetical protein AK812_SmicGene22649 [Symbiodinium microadriaticum]